MDLVSLEKRIRAFSAEEFVSFKRFLINLEQEIKERSLEELHEPILKLSPSLDNQQ